MILLVQIQVDPRRWIRPARGKIYSACPFPGPNPSIPAHHTPPPFPILPPSCSSRCPVTASMSRKILFFLPVHLLWNLSQPALWGSYDTAHKWNMCSTSTSQLECWSCRIGRKCSNTKRTCLNESDQNSVMSSIMSDTSHMPVGDILVSIIQYKVWKE